MYIHTKLGAKHLGLNFITCVGIGGVNGAKLVKIFVLRPPIEHEITELDFVTFTRSCVLIHAKSHVMLMIEELNVRACELELILDRVLFHHHPIIVNNVSVTSKQLIVIVVLYLALLHSKCHCTYAVLAECWK
jgi:hypothetical protein